jgi:hypothetical protein
MIPPSHLYTRFPRDPAGRPEAEPEPPCVSGARLASAWLAATVGYAFALTLLL